METATTEQPRKRHAPQDWEINQIWAEPLIHCHVRLPNLKVCSLEVGVWFVPRRTDADPLEWGWQVCEETGLVRWNCPDFRNKDHFPTWEAALADAFRALLRLGDDAAAARLAAFEAGPADGGAPAAGWAELDREGMAAFAERYPTAAAEPDDDARDPESEGLGVSGENPVLGHYSPSPGILVLGTNGGHDRADAAGILLDPDKVTATLTEAGWSIAFLADERGGGVYVNYALGDEYETGEVEAAYRAALSGRGAA